MFSIPLSLRPVAWAGLLLFAAGSLGCSPQTTEQALLGRWRAADQSGLAHAFKIKSDHPDANGSQAVAASMILAATSLELKKDGEFALTYGAGKYAGSWKLDNEETMVELGVKTLNGKAPDPKNDLVTAFLGTFDRADGSLRLYPVDRKGYEESKQRGESGPQALSVLLRKG